MPSDSEKAINIWVDVQQKIVSFHPLEHQECLSFSCREHFVSYIYDLIERGFRFM